MNQPPVGAILCLLLGFATRIAIQRFETRHVAWAYEYLIQTIDEGSDERREVLLERTHKALSFARLGRLASLVFLIPSAVLVIDPLLEGIGGASGFALSLALGAVVPFTLLALVQAWLMAGFYRDGSRGLPQHTPDWLMDEGERVPGIIEAGWSLWDGLVRAGENLSRRVSLVRPQAYLVEQDEQLVMAVGDREFGAIDHSPLREKRRRAFGDRDERDMIRAIQRLDETLVREVMRPLNNVTALALGNLTSEKFLNVARRTGFTRFPCYYDQVTNLIGYLNVHDFLDSPVLPPDPRKLIHQALFIPELARVDIALREMQKARQQIAICFDEYGGCSGLLSREDIIEEITGEIMDEYDRPELKIQEQHGEYLVDGTVDLDDLEEMLGLDLSRDTYVTLSGFLFYRLSRMPRRGEAIEEHGWKMEVAQIEGHRIRKVRLVPPADFVRPSVGPTESTEGP